MEIHKQYIQGFVDPYNMGMMYWFNKAGQTLADVWLKGELKNSMTTMTLPIKEQEASYVPMDQNLPMAEKGFTDKFLGNKKETDIMRYSKKEEPKDFLPACYFMKSEQMANGKRDLAIQVAEVMKT